jgi:hypothetical protein
LRWNFQKEERHMAYRLGKNRPVVDARTLRFSSYVTPALQPAPPSVDYGASVSAWPIYYNDQYGDCTCAAAAHLIQNWTANAGNEITPADSTVLSFYEHFVGTPPPADEGCDMLSVLKYWRRTGLDEHKVTAFASIQLQDKAEAMNAMFLLGGIYIGVALPDSVVPPGGNYVEIPWVVPPEGPVAGAAPNQNNGHCIPAVGYDATNIYVITWGAVKSMSWQFYDAYADEAFAIVSQDFVDLAGQDPVGFSRTQMLRDLKELTE